MAAYSRTWASGERVQFHHGHHCRIFREAQLREVFAFKTQANRFANIHGYFIQRVALRHHGKTQTLGHILFFASENANPNGASQGAYLMHDSTLEFCHGR